MKIKRYFSGCCFAFWLFGSTILAGTVNLAWNAPASTGLTGYNVYRSVNADGSAAVKVNATLISATTLTYSDAAAPTGTFYYYATALNGAAESVKSNIVQAIVPGPPPAPTNLRIVSVVP